MKEGERGGAVAATQKQQRSRITAVLAPKYGESDAPIVSRIFFAPIVHTVL
jgi:hypothetical protein